MTKEGYGMNNFYQGGYSSFSPSYGDVFTGYHVSAGELGAPTKPDTANQIQQVNQLLNQGIVPIEVGVLRPEIFDQIPKQHFKELKRMGKLTGSKLSVHAPLIEPSGITEQGWSAPNRELAERQLTNVVEKAIEMEDKEPIPITIHSSGLPGTEYVPTPGGKKIQKMVVINQETGKMAPMDEELKHYPRTEDLAKGEKISPEENLEMLNESEWDNSLSQVTFYKEGADRILQDNAVQIQHLMEDLDKKRIDPETGLTASQQHAFSHVTNAETYLRNARQHLSGLFDKAYKYGNSEEKKRLEEVSEKFKKNLPEPDNPNILKTSQALQTLIYDLRKVHPKTFVPVEDFAIEHSSKTFANVAWNAYDLAKKKNKQVPMISIENLFPGMAFSMGDEMKNLIEESRKKFVEKAIDNGMPEHRARDYANRIIGMTLDVGHLNIGKKQGFKDKDLLKEVEKIAKYVGHVHLTDNFGYGDSHLPPGMGNVPFKEILETLEKQGKGKDARKIVEAGGFVQHFQRSPYPEALRAMGSPIYSMNMQPYWNQAQGLYQDYSSGYGQILPQMNYETFGAGFSQLPMELGGQRGGAKGSRMSGKPME